MGSCHRFFSHWVTCGDSFSSSQRALCIPWQNECFWVAGQNKGQVWMSILSNLRCNGTLSKGGHQQVRNPSPNFNWISCQAGAAIALPSSSNRLQWVTTITAMWHYPKIVERGLGHSVYQFARLASDNDYVKVKGADRSPFSIPSTQLVGLRAWSLRSSAPHKTYKEPSQRHCWFLIFLKMTRSVEGLAISCSSCFPRSVRVSSLHFPLALVAWSRQLAVLMVELVHLGKWYCCFTRSLAFVKAMWKGWLDDISSTSMVEQSLANSWSILMSWPILHSFAPGCSTTGWEVGASLPVICFFGPFWSLLFHVKDAKWTHMLKVSEGLCLHLVHLPTVPRQVVLMLAVLAPLACLAATSMCKFLRLSTVISLIVDDSWMITDMYKLAPFHVLPVLHRIQIQSIWPGCWIAGSEGRASPFGAAKPDIFW